MSERDPKSLILEGVMTTLPRPDAPGEEANIAPMGPIVDASLTHFVLRPFKSSTTYRNLKATGVGVFHVTDDVLLIARAAVGRVRAGQGLTVTRAAHVPGVVLSDACRYHELRVTELDDAQERTRIVAQCVHRGVLREFLGFNRARHAVLEAAILATRLHLAGGQPVLQELDRLQVTIDKTGSDREQLAMTELRTYVQQHSVSR